jgi:Fatty acid hydroxylase superfamily
LEQSRPLGWYGLIYGYIVWELGHFIYHYLAHKVRLLWCLHSTHHAPENLNIFVSYSHFVLEQPYADIVRTSICILLGLSPPLLILIMSIDAFWGRFIHVGENILKALMREIMRRGSRIVLNADAAGTHELRTDYTIIRYPDRYSDKRGGKIWAEVVALLAQCRPVTTTAREVA